MFPAVFINHELSIDELYCKLLKTLQIKSAHVILNKTQKLIVAIFMKQRLIYGKGKMLSD